MQPPESLSTDARARPLATTEVDVTAFMGGVDIKVRRPGKKMLKRFEAAVNAARRLPPVSPLRESSHSMQPYMQSACGHARLSDIEDVERRQPARGLSEVDLDNERYAEIDAAFHGDVFLLAAELIEEHRPGERA